MVHRYMIGIFTSSFGKQVGEEEEEEEKEIFFSSLRNFSLWEISNIHKISLATLCLIGKSGNISDILQ